ncbi:MAG: hypothetical protein FJ216_04430 [Ignavibacteria bacterium]|nr:hypothetical protein [Ignavibacteria bacterium]
MKTYKLFLLIIMFMILFGCEKMHENINKQVNEEIDKTIDNEIKKIDTLIKNKTNPDTIKSKLDTFFIQQKEKLEKK